MIIIYKGHVVNGTPEEIRSLLCEPIYETKEKFPCEFKCPWQTGTSYDGSTWCSTSTGNDKDIEVMRPNEWADGSPINIY